MNLHRLFLPVKKFSTLTLFSLLSLSATAEIEKVFTLDATGVQVTSDSAGHFVYVPDQKNQRIVIVDSNTLQQEASVILPGKPQDIALDEQQQRAYVTVNSFSQIFVIDLNTYTLLDPIALPQSGYEIELNDQYIFVTSYERSSGIMRIDRASDTYMDMFSQGVNTYHRGAIELTPDKSRLVFANRGLSPGTLAIFDVTSDTPNLLIKNGHGDLGSNGQAISVDPVAGDFVSYAVGGGNGSGYTIAKLNIDTLGWEGEFATGAYPRAVHHSINGYSTYTNNTAGEVTVWDNTVMMQADSFAVVGDPKDFADLQGGALLAVIGNQEFAIYQIDEFNPEPPAPELSGDIQGATVNRVACVNKTTGQRVVLRDTNSGFDCVKAGLVIKADDDVRINIQAVIHSSEE